MTTKHSTRDLDAIGARAYGEYGGEPDVGSTDVNDVARSRLFATATNTDMSPAALDSAAAAIYGGGFGG